MKLKIITTLIITLSLSGCFKEDGQIRITSDVENAIIYIDGDKKGMTGDGYTTIIIEEGEHKVRVYKEKNDEWYCEGEQDVFVGANSSVKIKIDTDEKPTEFRLKRLAREKKEREERLAREKKEREERLAREKKEREERLAREKKEREERLAREKKERLAVAKKHNLSSYPIGTFYDVDTKLMWQDNKDAKTVFKDWDDSKDYCKSLTIGEYSDWRLPDYNTLLSIVDYNRYDPAIKKGFKNVASRYYWSSSEGVSDSSKAWKVYFRDGFTYYNFKSDSNRVRCVRGRQ